MAGAVLLASAVARAQPTTPAEGSGWSFPLALGQNSTASHRLSDRDAAGLRQALDAAKRADVNGARNAIASMGDSLARKTAMWALVDSNGDSLSFFELDQARRDLQGWPHAAKRQIAAEKQIETSGKTPHQIAEWFGDLEPLTPQGAMALASAYRALGQPLDATLLINRWWRDKPFEADVQRTMLARFGSILTVDDHVRRADILLYGVQGPAARDMIALLPADQQATAVVRMALRANAANANDLLAALPADAAHSPGVAFEHAAYLRRRGLDGLAVAELPYFPKEIATTEQGDRIWDERRAMVLAALKVGDSKAAYQAAADSGLTSGADAADAEFYAGWLALTRLKDPHAAARHFAALEKIGTTSITRGRALYWQGRAAEAAGQGEPAQDFYERAARHQTTFYGQMAAERLGQRLVLGADPKIDIADRTRFEAREPVQATRMLFENGQRDLFRTFALSLDDTLPSAEEEALLVDLVRGYGEQDTSMKVVRSAAQRGFILPQRGYPYRTPPQVAGGPEPALVLGITRQESGFDPMVRSGVGARGMMQLMPSTAAVVARKIGVSYSPNLLDEPDYNMRLGSSFLGHMVDNFSGSYVMAIAAYNAGPGRPTQWSAFCGDPRSGITDPVDFIECIPFSETRNYVMRVMEGLQVYRAKANGGSAPITLYTDMRRGGYGYPRSPLATPTVAATGNTPNTSSN